VVVGVVAVVVLVVVVVVVGVVVVVLVGAVVRVVVGAELELVADAVEDTWHVWSMNSDSMALRSLKSATVKTVLCSPGGDAMPRSSSSLMSPPIPIASHANTRSLPVGGLVEMQATEYTDIPHHSRFYAALFPGPPGHSLGNWDSCPTPAKSEAIEYLQVGPTEIRYSIAWTIFVYL